MACSVVAFPAFPVDWLAPAIDCPSGNFHIPSETIAPHLQVLIVGLISPILPCIAFVFFCAPPPIAQFPPKNAQFANGTLFGRALVGGIPLAIGSLLAMLSVFWAAGLAMDDLLGSADLFWSEYSENVRFS